MKVDLKGVHTVQAAGRTYRYAWRGGPRLHTEPGTDAFLRELVEARDARRGGDKSKLAHVIALYRANDAWRGLATSTRRNWSPWLDRIQVKFGATSTAAFDRPKAVVVIRHWRDGWKDKPRSADVAIQVFSRVLSFAAEEGLLSTNVCTNIPTLYRNDRADLIWTAADLAKLEAVASPEVMQAARLAMLTGLRQGDLLRLSWSHVGELSIELATGKSKGRRRTLVPMYEDLRQALAAIPKRATTVLTNTRGHPWKSGFGASWQAAVQAAGVDLHFHDLRGTAATRLYLAGFSPREIAEVLAWSPDQVDRILNRYVLRDALLRDRIRRLENAPGTEGVKTPVKQG